MWTKRAGDLVAAFVVGNGVLDLVAPRQRVFLWVFGPEQSRKKLALWFADHPTAMRLQGIARVGTGLWLASRQYREAPQPSRYQRWSSRYGSASLLAPVGLLVAIPLITVFYRRSRSGAARNKGKPTPTVARVIELSATSETSFEDAIDEGISRANETLRGVEGAWVKDRNVLIEDGNIKGYKVNLAVTFVMEDGA